MEFIFVLANFLWTFILFGTKVRDVFMRQMVQQRQLHNP